MMHEAHFLYAAFAEDVLIKHTPLYFYLYEDS